MFVATKAALPIDPLLPEVVDCLTRHRLVVLEAPPGAGKTTRVPLAILNSSLAGGRQIWVLEPRRIAARLAARYVAQSLAERVGERVGYRVRFESAVSERTRLLFMTEGLLARHLVEDPKLSQVGVVVFDEFHERHLSGDLGLALLSDLRRSRPDLALLVMSATLDGERIASFLDGGSEASCVRLTAQGRQFPVETEFDARVDDRPLEVRVLGALRRLVASELNGDVLVFLPGVGEIERVQRRCAQLAREHNLLMLPLHGSLRPEDQERAIQPADRRKVILATNVAETSVTIDGVTAVVDCGLARKPVLVTRAGKLGAAGRVALQLRPISRASAEQRRGRAGRTQPGRCLRLYTRRDLEHRPEHEEPEILRSDLSDLVLACAAAGTPAESLRWLDAPPPAPLAGAQLLLGRLGALHGDKITDVGAALAALPVHARLGRVLLEAARLGVVRQACEIAAIISEGDPRIGDERREAARTVARSDLGYLADLVWRAGHDEDRVRRAGLRSGAVRRLRAVAGQLLRAVERLPASVRRRHGATPDPEEAVLRAILTGYPDRVAKLVVRDHGRGQGAPGALDVVMATGERMALAEQSVVRQPGWVVVVSASERGTAGGRSARAEWVSGIEADWLLDVVPDALADDIAFHFDPRRRRVQRIERLSYGALALDESREPAQSGPDACRVFAEGIGVLPIGELVDPDALAGLRRRLEMFAQLCGQQALTLNDEVIRDAAVHAASGGVSLDGVEPGWILSAALEAVGSDLARRLDRGLPREIQLPSGRRLVVHYEAGRPPWVESYLQDFFGMRNGPTLLDGAQPLTLHLLAPNRRAVQVTTDLGGFWQRHYPVLCRQLSRRYPRHDWPDDPLTARPPAPRGRRKRK